MTNPISGLCNQSQQDLDNLDFIAKQNGKKLRVEVIADNSGKFCGNGLTFATTAEAVAYGDDLANRWFMVREFRVVQADQ